MKRLILTICFLILSAGHGMAQKGIAEPDFYPIGYSLDTWTGEVTAFDNDLRTLTLKHVSGKKESIFVATIPNSPYEVRRDGRDFNVIDFPFDKKASVQAFRYVANAGLYHVPPDQVSNVGKIEKRANPPVSNVIDDFSQFLGRTVTVYYMTPERVTAAGTEKYHDVWRIKVLPKKK